MQPSVSRVICKVEAHIGVTLLHRTGRGVELTLAGTQVLAATKQSLDWLSEARENARRSVGVISGRIAIGITPMIGQTTVTRAIESIRRDHPAIELRVLEGNGRAITNWLDSGEIALAVSYIPPPQIRSDLGEVLANERVCLVGKSVFAQELVEFGDLPRYALALPGPSSGLRRHLDRLANAAHVELDVTYQIDSFPTCIGLVLEGLVYTIAPEFAVRSMVKTGAVHAVRIVNPPIYAKLSVHRSPRMPLSRAARAFILALKETLPTE
jgi:DNA-binding transcriptional LysR family regulator